MKNCDIFLFCFAKNIDCRYRLEPLLIYEYPNLYFRAKINKHKYSCKTPVKLYKRGVYGAIVILIYASKEYYTAPSLCIVITFDKLLL